jgi:hypothetical protein
MATFPRPLSLNRWQTLYTSTAIARKTCVGKIHLSHGGRKAYLNFELKDAPKARGLRPSQILDFEVQIRSGLPCDE